MQTILHRALRYNFFLLFYAYVSFSFVSVCFVWESREVGKAVAKIISLALDLDANFFDQPEMLGD